MSEWTPQERRDLIRAVEGVKSEVGCLYWVLLVIAFAVWSVASHMMK